ncbi:uncharacterized protein LOC121025072 [Herpailurus yagouaroundi]|uniref:uncharacterized protein LOC121025072 n=1 Tax=Herpailurus yagouaroundi TaxID=1608482 RepID=UPI001AD6B182|nr:uncharacterized protein LOC121025072 [Puma yagouaroundi]
MAKIPSRTFPGLPNLRRLDLNQNKLDARGLHPCAFKELHREFPGGPQTPAVRSRARPPMATSHPWPFSPYTACSTRGWTETVCGPSYLACQPPCSFGCGCGSSWAPPAHPTPEHPSCRKLETLDLSHDPLVHVPSFRHGAFGACHRTTTARAHPRLRVCAHEAGPGAPVPVPRKPVHRRRPWRVLPRPSRLPDRAAAGSQPAAGRPPGPRGPQGAAGAASEPQEDQTSAPEFHLCDTPVAQDSNLIPTHLENSLIDRRRILPTAFSCI